MVPNNTKRAWRETASAPESLPIKRYESQVNIGNRAARRESVDNPLASKYVMATVTAPPIKNAKMYSFIVWNISKFYFISNKTGKA